MSGTIYGGITRNGIDIESEVDDHFDYVYHDDRFKGFFARLAQMLREKGNFDTVAPAIVIFGDEDPYKPILAKPLDGDFDKYQDFFGQGNELCDKEVELYWDEIAENGLLEMITMTVYCDTTGLYTEDEVNEDNLTEMDFPKAIVKAFFDEVINEDGDYDSFEEWLDDCCADDTEELYEFAEARGFKAKRGDSYDFKAGDKVRVLTLEKLEEKYGEAEEDGSIDTLGGYVFGAEMREFCGKTATVIDVDAYKVALRFDDPELSNPRQFVWTMNMLEPCTDYVSMERMKELLNLVVDHVCVARDSKEAIQKLLYIGFEKDELINVFHFGAGDVQDAEESMDEYEE